MPEGTDTRSTNLSYQICYLLACLLTLFARRVIHKLGDQHNANIYGMLSKFQILADIGGGVDKHLVSKIIFIRSFIQSLRVFLDCFVCLSLCVLGQLSRQYQLARALHGSRIHRRPLVVFHHVTAPQQLLVDLSRKTLTRKPALNSMTPLFLSESNDQSRSDCRSS